MTYQDWKTFPWTKSAGHNCLYALIKHTVWWWHPRLSFTHFLLRSFRRREAGTDSLTRTRQSESCAGNLVVWLQNGWDSRVLIGTGRRKEPRVAFTLLPRPFEVHLCLGYEEVSIKCLSSPQHFTTHLGHGWGEIKIPTDHFRPSVCVSSSVLLVSTTYSVTRRQIPCGKRLCTTLAPNPPPHTPNRRVPRESPSDWFHEWRQVLCKLVHGALFSSWEPWKTEWCTHSKNQIVTGDRLRRWEEAKCEWNHKWEPLCGGLALETEGAFVDVPHTSAYASRQPVVTQCV